MAIEMKIRYLGTAAAEGVPAVFCKCGYCENIRKLGASQFRARTQVLIDDCLAIDFPPDAYVNSLKFGVNLGDIRALLVTHSHMDHFYAHDFILRGYKYAKVNGEKLKIFGNAEVEKVFSECTAREMKGEVAANIEFVKIAPYDVFTVGGYKICALPARHSRTEDALLFHISKDEKGYLHLYDTGRIADEAFAFLKSNNLKADLVGIDCTFGESEGGENSRHMGLPDDLIMRRKLEEYNIVDENTRFVLTHFSHNCNPTRERMESLASSNGFIAAYDGLGLEI